MTREEAIKTIRLTCPKISDSECDFETAMRFLIPELRESEDERIRKEIILHIKDQIDSFISPPDCRDKEEEEEYQKYKSWLAWLEKQKYDRMKPVYDNQDSFESALEKAWKDYNDSGARTVDGCEDDYIECAHAKGFREGYLFGLEKQKEPLPIPDKFSGLKSLMLQYLQSAANRKDDSEIESDTDLWGRKILDYVWKYSDEQKEQKPEEKPINWTELTWKDIDKLEGIINNVHYEFRSGIGQESFGKEVLEKFREYKGDEYLDEKEQKPAEWSEEDRKMIDHLIEALPMWANGRIAMLPSQAEEYVERLKSLRPQPKQEWSEKEYGILFDIEHYLDGTLQLSPDRKIACIDFLKSLRPSWKPSEEQMEALENSTALTEEQGEALYSLIKDLKKL